MRCVRESATGSFFDLNGKPPPRQSTPFLAATGNASLTGRASIRADGTELPSAGQPVTLDPATSSSRRWYERTGMDWTVFNSGSPDDPLAARDALP